MKKLFSIVLSLVLALCCFGMLSAEGTADEIIVNGNPAQELIVHDEGGTLFYNAANEYYIINGTQVTILIALPDYADPAQTYYQIAFDWWETHYFTDLPQENGYYVMELEIDSLETTGYPMSDFQLYINQDGNQDTHWPDYIINLYADEANFTTWLADFPEVTWEYAEEEPVVTDEPTETEEPIVTDEPTETEEPVVTDEPAETEEPVVTDEPIETEEPVVTDEPTNTTPSTGGIALVGLGIASLLAGGAVLLARKKEN